jgi:hypothetical protein
MPVDPKLTEQQKDVLRVLEPALREAAHRANYEAAKRCTAEIQALLRPTGQENRLLQAKAWLYEAAMEAGHYQLAESGFIGIRKKTKVGTRLNLEATALHAVCHLRQKQLEKAEPLIKAVLTNRSSVTESRRKRFIRHVTQRFEEEGLLAALKTSGTESLNSDDIHDEAGILVQTKNEDELFADIGSGLPGEAVHFLLKVDAMAKRALNTKELKYLPGETAITERAQLGRSTFASFKRVLWRSLCDPESEIYKAWCTNGLMWVVDRKFLAVAVSTALLDLGIGIKALAVSATALLIKFGLDVYCDRFSPDFILDDRRDR